MATASERFLRYVTIDTQSDGSSPTCPSTDKQRIFGAMLVEEMLAMGIADAHMDENGYVYGTVPGDPSLPTIGLIAHMDTSPDASGANVKPRVVEYDGSDILLNEDLQMYLSHRNFPNLKKHVGKHLIVTDGTTLLGADDKAGVAEIMTVAEMLLKRKINHATLKIGFTPDEEVGRGADLFNVKDFAADYAYTVDGGAPGEITYENFNAAGASVVIHGLGIHPGSAKGKMVNSQYIAMEFQSLLPAAEKPEYTEVYDGFIHLCDMKGAVETSYLNYIIRDHDEAKFQAKKDVMLAAAAFINAKYGAGTAEVTITDSYFNMRKMIEPSMFIVDRAKQAMANLGIEPIVVPIRGGTDGARLSYMGLPCPNLGTGGDNCHGRYEFACVEDMDLCTELLLQILTTF